ncbi:MAG TPA: hypothetical protein VFW33_15250 [Gemmataceae bacterium]|nr:hypothetical protein [Gemmataceae bacterium]
MSDEPRRQDDPESDASLLQKSKALDSAGRYAEALRLIQTVIDRHEPRFGLLMGGAGGASEAERNKLARDLSEYYGKRGGILRRMDDIPAAIESYRRGDALEQNSDYGPVNSTYNRTNLVVLPLFLRPETLAARQDELRRVAAFVSAQTGDPKDRNSNAPRSGQWWAWADLGLLSLLTGSPALARDAYDRFADTGARATDYKSTVSFLEDCRDRLRAAIPEVAQLIDAEINFLKNAKSG